jgi:hypothetical protein
MPAFGLPAVFHRVLFLAVFVTILSVESASAQKNPAKLWPSQRAGAADVLSTRLQARRGANSPKIKILGSGA